MTDPMMKLYAGLTDTERAKLAFSYLAKDNDLERARIASVMPEQYFVGLPDGYRRMAINLSNLTLMYAVAYWQSVAQCLVLLAGVQAIFSDPDPEAYERTVKSFEAAEAALLAIEAAFDSVCTEHGLDAAVMRGMAGKRFYTIATPGIKPDDVCLAGYREIFASTMK